MADVGGIAAEQLRSYIERIENLHEQRDGIASDVSEVFQQAKSTGFDTKIMREILRLRRMEKEDRREHDDLLDLYKQALGMLE